MQTVRRPINITTQYSVNLSRCTASCYLKRCLIINILLLSKPLIQNSIKMSLLRTLIDDIVRAVEQCTRNNASSGNHPPSTICPQSEEAGSHTHAGDSSNILCHNPELISNWHPHELSQYHTFCSGKQCSWIIPFAGNSFLNSGNLPASDENRVTESGLRNWNTLDIVPSLFFHCDQPGSYLVGLRVQVPYRNTSTILVSIHSCTSQDQCGAPQSNQVFIEGNTQGCYQVVPCGMFNVGQEGYIKISLLGVQKSGSVYADVSHAILTPEEGNARQKRSIYPDDSATPVSLEKSCVKFVSSPDDFYFGRRGPSVHLNYEVPSSSNPEEFPRQIEYFYNEIVVPSGQDVIGAYFCAIGFAGGYFGIQVNSANERRVLFSIWSAYSTDNPDEIPRDYQVTSIRKGSKEVHVGEFGHEGSGAQSYLRYMWKSNIVYKFIVQAKPMDDDNSTMFSAWFSSDEENDNEWKLIASFRKPKDVTYLRGLYSFSENFIPEMGHVERQCHFGNQWAWDNNMENGKGGWVEVTKAKFTADETANKKNRSDVAGGVVTVQSYGWNVGSASGITNRFFLRNCGFFSDRVEPGLHFCRRESGCPPAVMPTSLP